MRAVLVALMVCAASLTAQAHGHRWHHHAHHRRRRHERHVVFHRACSGTGNVARARCMGLPWCGAEMADLFHIYGALGRNLWVARNWAHWGRAGAPGVGAVVVWPHHVGEIVGRRNGQWVIKSGNDGHAVRTRPRSIAGAIAIRWR